MATRWRWRRFKLKYMKLSSVFHGFWWIFANFSMIFGILCEHFGTVTQCSVDPTVPLSETLKKNHETSRKWIFFEFQPTNFHEFLHVLKPKTKHFMYFITQKRKYPFKLWKKGKPTAPSVPRRSPIQVLTRLNVA